MWDADVDGPARKAVPASDAAIWAAVAAVAEEWGAEYEPPASERVGAQAKILLPVEAGMRRGVVAATVRLQRENAASGPLRRLQVEQLDENLRLHRPAVAVLALSALAAGVTFLWPFFPRLLDALPVAALLALSGWFLVVQRLRTSGVEDFLASVLAALEGESPLLPAQQDQLGAEAGTHGEQETERPG